MTRVSLAFFKTHASIPFDDNAGCRPNSPHHFRGGRLQVCSDSLLLGTWNVEGRADAKVVELQHYMLCNSITILCRQDWLSSAFFITDAGFLLINSGQLETEDAETAGVGFIVAPSMRRSVVSFCQASSRMASLKTRVPGGKMTVCSIYAPHNDKSVDERRSFFHNMSSWLTSRSRHGPLCVLGDFNARLHRRFETDPRFIALFVFGNPDAQVDANSNRSFLVELCESNNLAVANTFFSSVWLRSRLLITTWAPTRAVRLTSKILASWI